MAVTRRAVVWRHWYTTLNEMLSSMDETERADVVSALGPGERCVASEWYLAIPAYSAAFEEAQDLVWRLTSRESELQRIVHGVGMPTRRSFYFGASVKEREQPLSPLVRLRKFEVGNRLENAFRRSRYRSYPVLSWVLSSHLQQILDFAPMERRRLRRETQDTLKSAINAVKYGVSSLQNMPAGRVETR
jgi:hypothetical protein